MRMHACGGASVSLLSPTFDISEAGAHRVGTRKTDPTRLAAPPTLTTTPVGIEREIRFRLLG